MARQVTSAVKWYIGMSSFLDNNSNRHSGARVKRANYDAQLRENLEIPGLRFAHPGMTLSIAGQFKIAHTLVAAAKTDRSFPIGKTRPHPAPRIQRRGFDGKAVRGNDDAPRGRHLAAL